jgi:saccharopine dehydrogenase-like NADP-dependent oxidoreductase
MSFTKIAVLGLGKVGTLAATLIGESGFAVTGFDARTPREDLPFRAMTADLADAAATAEALKPFEAVLSCLPYRLNVGVAKAAHGLGLHYFDLTEDVSTTRAIIDMSVTANGVMAPQCGLAPGFVGIVGADLARQFDRCRAIRLRVGALPRNPTGLMGYAFNWSPEGVVNEYLNDCEVIEEGRHKWVSPMEWVETLYIDGSSSKPLPPRAGSEPCARPSWARLTTSTTKPSAIRAMSSS